MNPIEAAVAPLKNDAIEKAAKYAEDIIAGVLADLVNHDMDLTKAAPFPEATMRRASYVMAKSKHNLYAFLTQQFKDDPRMKALKVWEVGRRNSPDIRERCAEQESKFIDMARKDAGIQYDAFVAKLIEKCSVKGMTITRASLKGSHVWGYSFLTVEFWDETQTTLLRRDIWKTQQIVNVSKLGKVFNQWPTRKVKP